MCGATQTHAFCIFIQEHIYVPLVSTTIYMRVYIYIYILYIRIIYIYIYIRAVR